MLKKYLLQLKAHHRQAWREQKGQSIVIIAFAIVAIVVLMGLALDLGLVYIERVRISRTTDAAALAAVVELPYEEEAIRRAIEYIELNGYRPGIDTEIKVRGCIVINDKLENVNEDGELNGNANLKGAQQPPANRYAEGYSYPGTITPPADDIVATFVIDTMAYQPAPDNTTKSKEACTGSMSDPDSALFGTANKLRVSGQVKTSVNFMQVIGFGDVFVSDEAVGENVANLDVVVVFDISGSMDYETNCFGCWNKDPDADIMEDPFPNNGTFNPLRYDGNKKPFWGGNNPTDLSTAGDAVCSQPVSYEEAGSKKYSVHEAELYSNMGVGPNNDTRSWRFEAHAPGRGFWVLQRPEAGVSSNDAFMRAHSFVTYGLPVGSADAKLQGGTYNQDCWSSINGCWGTPKAPNNPPFLDYDFTVDWGSSDSTHVWVRAIAGSERSEQWKGDPREADSPWRNALYFRVIDNAGVEGKLLGGPLASLLKQRDDAQGIRELQLGQVDPATGVKDEDKWRWVKINNEVLNLPNGQYTLRIYQGSSAFNLDKIVITNDSTGIFDQAQPNFLVGGFEGPAATPGSATREACNMCNPSYGQKITDGATQCSCNLSSADHVPNAFPDLFPGQAEGSAFNCTRVTEPTDMLGDDLFHDRDPIRSAKEAVKNFANRLDPRFDQLGVVAFNQDVTEKVKLQCKQMWGDACFSDTDAISYTEVIEAVEDFTPDGLTDISEGMREGLEELGLSVETGVTIGHNCTNSDTQACDRQGAARRVLILITDGAPSAFEGGDCTGSDKLEWRGTIGKGSEPYNCAIYYAREAAKHNVAVYTIGVGPGVDKYLLTAMAKGDVPLPDSSQPCETDPDGNSNGHDCDDPDGAFYFTARGGAFYPALRPTDLDGILEAIIDNIYVRIVG